MMLWVSLVRPRRKDREGMQKGGTRTVSLKQAKMLEDLLDDLLVLYEAYHSHGTRALWPRKMIHLPGSSPGQAAIFCFRRAQLFLNSLLAIQRCLQIVSTIEKNIAKNNREI
jgi:hypothetical protein